MLHRVFALACGLFWIAGSVNVRGPAQSSRLRGRSPDHLPEARISHSSTDAVLDDLNQTILQRSLAANHADAALYTGCNGTACSTDVSKVKHDLKNDLVLIFGCSLDINAIEYFCKNAGAPVKNFATRNPFSYLAHCDVGTFTLAYIFHPGASPAPYFNEYAGTATTRDVVKNSVHDVQMQFGRQPTAVIVDASLWDVSNWWQKHGRPTVSYAAPKAEILRWCDRDVPELLGWVQTNFPQSGVAFRTPPTVFNDNTYGQRTWIIEGMVACIEQHKDPLNKLYGQYGFIDFHHFVDQALEHAQGPSMPAYYKDTLHPGPALSLMYVNRVLNFVGGLHR